MKRAGPGVLVAIIAVIALVAPAAASAHAYLIRTVPSAATILDTPPSDVALTYDEAVEPRFGIISVTNEDGHQVATASPSRSPSDPDTLVVPLKPKLPEGWYLVYWRVISVDGHPVQGAFTFAIGPNPGPAPQFVDPAHRLVGDDAPADRRQVGRVPDRDALGRPPRDAARDREAGGAAGRGDEATRGHGGVRCHLDPRPARGACVPRGGNGDRLAPFLLPGRLARPALADDCVRPELLRPLDLLRALLPRRLDRSLGRPARPRATLDRRAARRAGCRRGSCGLPRRPRGGRPRSADLPARTRRRPRLAPRQLRRALARGARRTAAHLVESGGGEPYRGALGRRSSLLERRLRLGSRASRLGCLGGGPAPADPLGALDDLLRPGDHGQGHPARRGDARRLGQPPPDEAPARGGAQPARARPPGGLAPARSRLGRGGARRPARCSRRPC